MQNHASGPSSSATTRKAYSVAKHREHPEYKTFAGALVALLENGQASLDVHQFQEL
ncbi:hypothetical protein PF011_g23980 [Phytophthora fragariae]|uniref:Uncharacterized protein n=1 Tax=Phytophthora fragariae TaxID=53985 RepID=A0A6A3I323_9STRA|nr:hypothetical protein PF011_g23980 [Phytophthora fragariae]